MKNPRTLLIAFITAVVVMIVVMLVIFIPRVGKTAVDIRAIPENTAITINGKSASAGTHYLAPGVYTIKGSLDGYSEDIHSVTVGEEKVVVGILPEPTSEAAQKYLSDNPDIQTEREALGGINANREGAQVRADNPIIAKLPYIDKKDSLFAIDYGVTNENPKHVYLLIGNSSPEGRANAITWLKKEGVNIETTDIRYDDFVNPLLGASN